MSEVEKKTVREWIETLPEYIRDRALANVRAQGMEEQLGVNVASLSGAIIITFGWRGTPEGKRFWNKVSNGKHPRIKRRFKYRARLAELERAVRELKEAQAANPQSSAHRSTPVPDADADHKARRIQSISEAYSSQPVTYVVVDNPSNKESVKEIVLEDDWGFPTYCGYNFDGEPLFEYLADSVNVHYFPDSTSHTAQSS